MVNVGVVITTYGRYNYISEAIESTLKQTLKPKEIVVVADDPDRVPFKDRVYVVEARDRKYGTTIMKGVDATTSDVIAILDDDDKFHPDKLRIVARILERHPEVTAVHNMQAYIDANGKPISDNDPRVRDFVKGQPEFILLVNKGNAWRWFRKYGVLHGNNSSMVVRRSVFERHGLIINDVELLMDFVLFTLSVHEGHYLHIPERLTIYRVGSGETTMSIWGDPLRVKRRLCTEIRYWHDHYLLLRYAGGPNLRRLITEAIAAFGDVTAYWVYGWFLDCGVKTPISAADVLYYALKRLELINNLLDIIYVMRGILITLFSVLDRKWFADIRLRRDFGIDLSSLLINNKQQGP